MKYKIDYEYGVATLFTPCKNWKQSFNVLASECFGIRKSIGEIKLLDKSEESPKHLLVGEYERLCYYGDVVVWGEDGKKIKSEFELFGGEDE